MKRNALGLGCLLAAAFYLLASSVAGAEAHDAQRYVVVYRTGEGASSSRHLNVVAETSRVERSYGFRSRHRYSHALKGFSASLTGRQVARLRRDRNIALVARDRVLHAGGRVPLAPGETVPVPTGIARIDAATPAGVHQASTTAVAIIDTGVDLTNPAELNVDPGPNCVGTGPPADTNGHGTFVAGVVGARNTGVGIVGVAPGTKLYAVKSLNSQGGGLESQVICGIDWVTANASGLGIRVANLSLGGPDSRSRCDTDPLHLAICNSSAAGVTYAVAAGNDGADFGARPEVPASFPEVLTVTAASDSDGRPGGAGGPPTCRSGEIDDAWASFSDFAVSEADAAHVVAAPGICIRSTVPGGQATDSGTSAASPHVAGVIALCMGEGGVPGPCSGMSSAEVIQQIRADAAANATPGNGFLGDPNHPLGPYFGFMVSALDPSIRRLPLPPAPEPPPQPVTDSRVDLRSVRVRKVQDVDHLRVDVTLGEAGTVTVSVTVQIPSTRAAARVRFKSVSREAAANRPVVLRPRASRRSLRLVKRQLRRSRRLRASIVVVARDRAANSLSTRRSVRLRR